MEETGDTSGPKPLRGKEAVGGVGPGEVQGGRAGFMGTDAARVS